MKDFQEKLVETAAAVWRKIHGRTIVINALLNIVAECDCLPGANPGFIRISASSAAIIPWRWTKPPEDDRTGPF